MAAGTWVSSGKSGRHAYGSITFAKKITLDLQRKKVFVQEKITSRIFLLVAILSLRIYNMK